MEETAHRDCRTRITELERENAALAVALQEYAEKVSIASKEDGLLWLFDSPSHAYIERVRALWRAADEALKSTRHEEILSAHNAALRKQVARECAVICAAWLYASNVVPVICRKFGLDKEEK
jgi:hypothetical protein